MPNHRDDDALDANEARGNRIFDERRDDPILVFEDMDVTVSRTYRLAAPVTVEIDGRRVRAEVFQTTDHTWTTGQHETNYQVYGHRLKRDGSPDERRGRQWFVMTGPASKRQPDPRAAFLSALGAITG